jgi:hypothetical protein
MTNLLIVVLLIVSIIGGCECNPQTKAACITAAAECRPLPSICKEVKVETPESCPNYIRISTTEETTLPTPSTHVDKES